MAWIKIDHTTPDKPEVIRMAAGLKLDPDAVVGKLVRVWVWADQQSVDGNDVPVTSAFLDRLTGRKGFASAMRTAGWLTGAEGALTFPMFDRHNGETAKARAQTNRRVAEHRQRKGNADVTPPALQKPLPEKRREEEMNTGVCHAPAREVERPTLEQAKGVAEGIGITSKEAEDWWLAREGSEWTKGGAGDTRVKVGTNWQADAKSYTNTMRQKRADEVNGKSEGGGRRAEGRMIRPGDELHTPNPKSKYGF